MVYLTSFDNLTEDEIAELWERSDAERDYYRSVLSADEWVRFLTFAAVLGDNPQALLNAVGVARALEVMDFGAEEAIQYFDLNNSHVPELAKFSGDGLDMAEMRIKLYETVKRRDFRHAAKPEHPVKNIV